MLFAEIEIEFINDGTITLPNDAFVTQVVKTDATGTFSYTMPTASWWGFAALLEADAPMTARDGTQAPVEKGALIRVHATAPVAALRGSAVHIPDGILSAPVLAGGAALAAVQAAVTAFVVGFLARVQPGALAQLAVRA